MNALESGLIVVSRLAAVGDELVADVPIRVERDAYVTPAQVLAAKLAIELTEEDGEKPDEALKAIANAQVENEEQSSAEESTPDEQTTGVGPWQPRRLQPRELALAKKRLEASRHEAAHSEAAVADAAPLAQSHLKAVRLAEITLEKAELEKAELEVARLRVEAMQNIFVTSVIEILDLYARHPFTELAEEEGPQTQTEKRGAKSE